MAAQQVSEEQETPLSLSLNVSFISLQDAIRKIQLDILGDEVSENFTRLTQVSNECKSQQPH